MKTKKSLTVILLILLAASVSCRPPGPLVVGTWESTSISNPAPLFKNTLPDKRTGTVIFTLTKMNTFTWKNKDEKQVINGKWGQTGQELTLAVKGEKRIVLTASREKDVLTIRTDDGFTFTFKLIKGYSQK